MGVDRGHALMLLRQMVLIRRFEERAAELYTLGKIRGFLHLYIGGEAVAVGAMQALGAEDAIGGTYRAHGHALVRGIPAGSLMAEMYGKASGCSRGRGGSMHLFDASRRFYGGHAIVGGGLPVAVGLAPAGTLQGRRGVAACFFGGGAGPFLLEARTYRFRAHSMYDPELYRTRDEVEQWKARDPIARFTARLREGGLLADAGLAPLRAPGRAGGG